MSKIRNLLQRLRARFSEELPRDTQQMDRFVTDILTTYNLPTTSDYRRAVAKAVHGISQGSHRAPKFFFYSHMRRFEAMRAAVQLVTELERQDKQAATPPVGAAVVGKATEVLNS